MPGGDEPPGSQNEQRRNPQKTERTDQALSETGLEKRMVLDG